MPAAREDGRSRTAATVGHDAVTQVVFSTPQVASAGLTEAAARERGLPVQTLHSQIGAVPGGGLYADGYHGTATLVVDTARQVVVGATFVGPDVADMLHAATIAIVGQVPVAQLWHAVAPFPTRSEVWVDLLSQAGC